MGEGPFLPPLDQPPPWIPPPPPGGREANENRIIAITKGDLEKKMEPELTTVEVKRLLDETASAPRVTEESIKAKIAKVEYLLHDQMTICLITMVNGWTAHGVSKPASPENFNAEVGKRYAYDNAFRTLWQLEGYVLVTRRHEGW